MRTQAKLLAMLMAAVFGTAIVGCQREGSSDAQRQGSSVSPQAPGKQGPAGAPGNEGPAGSSSLSSPPPAPMSGDQSGSTATQPPDKAMPDKSTLPDKDKEKKAEPGSDTTTK